MAKNNSLATRGATGSAGGLTWSTAQGTDYFKATPTSVTQPATPKQREQWARMALCTLTGQQISDFVNIAFKQRAYPKTVFNQFTTDNLVADKMNVTYDANADTYTAAWKAKSLSVPANPSQNLTSNAGVASNQLQGDVSGAVEGRSYNVYFIAQDNTGQLGSVVKQIHTGDVGGIISLIILANAFNLNNMTACYYSVVDTVTGKVSNFTALA